MSNCQTDWRTGRKARQYVNRVIVFTSRCGNSNRRSRQRAGRRRGQASIGSNHGRKRGSPPHSRLLLHKSASGRGGGWESPPKRSRPRTGGFQNMRAATLRRRRSPCGGRGGRRSRGLRSRRASSPTWRLPGSPTQRHCPVHNSPVDPDHKMRWWSTRTSPSP
jgi:hypothetical protein